MGAYPGLEAARMGHCSIILSTNILDLILEPSTTLYIDKFAREDCLQVSSAYDTNLNESEHILSLHIRDTSVTESEVIFSRQNLTIYIEDYHGELTIK